MLLGILIALEAFLGVRNRLLWLGLHKSVSGHCRVKGLWQSELRVSEEWDIV